METPDLHPKPEHDAVGPYRLDGRLGRGGMGEVYRGYDERLDRPVALKRVRRELGDAETALRRFRREARAAARLRHPSIVQVHDWVETDDEAWLVMELVEGDSLRQILRSGTLEPSRVVQIAHDLLEGLAVAHDAGLVHRDLKAENVMITPVSSAGRGRLEQARILDFGLAKRSAAEAEETQLSIEGKIIGTLSAMAPEQVLGQEIDARTDLFALGCLLYEALTGRQAFVGESAGETLNRICTIYQVPVRERRPEVSASLSAFVDHLLEKDPRRRPASAHDALDELDQVSSDSLATYLEGLATENHWSQQQAATDRRTSPFETRGESRASELPARPARHLRAAPIVAALAIVAALLIGFWRLGEGEPAEPIHVAAPATTISEATDEAAELAARAVHTALLQGLVDLQGVVAIEVPAGQASVGPRQLARQLAADEVLASSLTCNESSCRAQLRRLGGGDGRVLWAQTFTVDTDRLLDTSQAVAGHLAKAYPGFERRESATGLEVLPEDYESYLRLLRRYESRDHGLSTEQLLAELERLGETSPRFVGIPRLLAHVSLQNFAESRTAADLARAERAVERALALAPEDPQVLMLAARAARQGGDLEAAASLLEKVRRYEPGYTEALLQLALLEEQRGDTARAVTLAREAATRRPSPYLLFNSADLLARSGDFAVAREFIERGLEIHPESFNGLSRLAQLELMHGDLERAATLYAQLVERSPEPTELTNLGTALMMLGRYAEAAESLERVMAATPDSPYAALNAADVAKLSGDVEEAEKRYRRVIELVEADPRPQNLASVNAQALAHLGRRQEAVEAIQSSLRRQPENPWVAFEAALVYALIDDRNSAAWNARRALDGGIEPRWFGLPFFDRLRPELGLDD